MAILRPNEIRKMSPDERRKKLEELRAELARLRALALARGQLDNPCRIREIRKAIARILTIEREEELKRMRERGKK
ncbi:MAG: 50S ribosomal protein L29 [Thermoprotei archaeon]|nr:MAG: 50S ribosomal protein L29 [Thermoprotei archaeon]RLF20762.1 MAG: 50S ribosomal protein L29 [Thermoprotei archaeon]